MLAKVLDMDSFHKLWEKYEKKRKSSSYAAHREGKAGLSILMMLDTKDIKQ